MTDKFESSIDTAQNMQPQWNAKNIFSRLIQEEQYVGDIFSINYETGKVLVHDYHRQKVGGIPSLCFLIATRITPGEEIDYKSEDASLILLRVMDGAQIPQDREAEKIRVETAQRVSGETSKHWDGEDTMDYKTRHVFSYAGISCRIIGTFYLEAEKTELKLKFGSDISNYYPNRGLKIYKPSGQALKEIVNFIDPQVLEDYRAQFQNNAKVELGHVRYASTHRKYQGVDDVPVFIYPIDLLAQKSALFGMTRTGKSNTTKIIAKSIYALRHPENPHSLQNPNGDKPLRIGQIIFDPNGEYANENTQDTSGNNDPTALKNIWELYSNAKTPEERKQAKFNEVITYGLRPHVNDPDRIVLKLNFYASNMLQNGKDIINSTIDDQDSQYFKNFRQVRFEKPERSNYENDAEFFEDLRRYFIKEVAYRALLNKAGFTPPRDLQPKLDFAKDKPLFIDELRDVMAKVNLPVRDKKKEALIKGAAETLGKLNASWDSLASAFEGLFYFLETPEYSTYNVGFIRQSKSGEGWADSDLPRILEMFTFSKGTNLIGKAALQHNPDSTSDYAADIYKHLSDGKLVIIDQSSGDYELNKSSAERIMKIIFKGNQREFSAARRPKDVIIYLEEAHNLLPSSKEADMQDIWVKTAKEGGKYKLGLVYATQEVSSIQKNILKNTANWFISHLNNADETKELCKYYDFADFEPSIRRAQDKGFLRVKTLSNMFVIPVQVNKFELNINKRQ